MPFGMRLSCSRGKMRRRDHARSSDSKMVRFSFGPWRTNWSSKRPRNSSASCGRKCLGQLLTKTSRRAERTFSSVESASSPTTAFIAAASLPIA